MLSPVIMIGCGGSGSKAIRYVRDGVERKLRASGWNGEMPSAWSFIGVDTLSKQEGEDADGIPNLPKEDFVHITEGLQEYATLEARLLTEFPTEEQSYGHLIGWRPNPEQVLVSIETGCGQIRAVGRAVGLYTLKGHFTNKLDDAFNRAKAGDDLSEVSKALGNTGSSGARTQKPPLVIVCASIGGGTGAGIALDVIDLMRRRNAHGKNAILVLFSIDIFGDSKTDMAGNSLGMLCELLASYWANQGDLGPGDVFEGDQKSPGHGPTAVFVVGPESMLGKKIRHFIRESARICLSGRWRGVV